MNVYFDAILSVIMMGPVMSVDRDEDDASRRQLYTPVALAISEVAKESKDPVRAASILIAVGQHESMFARYVLEGRCKDGPAGMQCDYNKRLRKSLSRGPWQIRKWCKKLWAVQDGSYESYVEGARCALEYVERGFNMCMKSKYKAWPGAFSFYRGQPCSAGEQVGSNFKGSGYTQSMVEARSLLKKFQLQNEDRFPYLAENHE